MKHLLEYRNYIINESNAVANGALIIDYLKNSEDGKFLQRLISGPNDTFDTIFKLVKTGRVYVKGRYAAQTRFYTNDYGQWCQISEASGRTYGGGCFNSMEEVVRYSITRFILLRRERGLNEKLLSEWVSSNWASVIKMNSADEVINAYKENSGLSSMITDGSAIMGLPSFKEYQGVFYSLDQFYGSINQFYGSIQLNVDPFNIYYAEDSVPVTMYIKLTNKSGYSGKEEIRQRNRTEISMGASDTLQLDQYFRKGLIYTLTKKYDALISREGVNNPSIDTLIAAKDLYLGMITAGSGNLVQTLEKIKANNPLAMGKVINALRKYNPGVVTKFEETTDKEEIRKLEKGASIINRFGF